VAAGVVCAVFVPFVLIHLLWAVGVTWGLNSELAGRGDTHAGIALTAVSLAAAAAATAAIIVTLARVDWLKTRLSDRMLHIGNWVVFAWPAIGTLNPLSTWGQRAVALPLAMRRSRSHGRTHGRRRVNRDGLRSGVHRSLTERRQRMLLTRREHAGFRRARVT
jgi:hypothetical protein